MTSLVAMAERRESFRWRDKGLAVEWPLAGSARRIHTGSDPGAMRIVPRGRGSIDLTKLTRGWAPLWGSLHSRNEIWRGGQLLYWE